MPLPIYNFRFLVGLRAVPLQNEIIRVGRLLSTSAKGNSPSATLSRARTYTKTACLAAGYPVRKEKYYTLLHLGTSHRNTTSFSLSLAPSFVLFAPAFFLILAGGRP